MEKDIAIGSAGEASIAQAAGKVMVKAALSQPISVGGDQLGKVDGSVDIELDELAVLKHLAAKYSSNVVIQEGIALISAAISALG